MLEIVDAASDSGRLALFRELIRQYQAWLPAELRVPDVEREIERLTERYREGALLLGLVGPRAIGCVVLHHIDRTTAELKRLYVVPDARGTGAGRALTEAAVALARDRGYERVVLDTHREKLGAAYALYRSVGFVECDAYGEAEYACPTFLELALK